MKFSQALTMMLDARTADTTYYAHNGTRVPFDSGFVVGGTYPGYMVPTSCEFSHLEEIAEYVSNIPQDCFIGIWRQGSLICIDVVDHVDEFWPAFERAYDRKQHRFYDVAFHVYCAV